MARTSAANGDPVGFGKRGGPVSASRRAMTGSVVASSSAAARGVSRGEERVTTTSTVPGVRSRTRATAGPGSAGRRAGGVAQLAEKNRKRLVGMGPTTFLFFALISFCR